jgi:transcriptional regulator with XRE-family HTH domain
MNHYEHSSDQDNFLTQQVALSLRAIRSSLGWSRRELSKRIGLGEATIARIERLERSPRSSSIDKLITAFAKAGIDISFEQDKLVITYHRHVVIESSKSIQKIKQPSIE